MLAIIPQDPFLFSGTIRENLDPNRIYTDEEIHRVLEKCYLRELVANLGNGLESMIVERGRNFSVGQKQVNFMFFFFFDFYYFLFKLFCLARALLRKAKVNSPFFFSFELHFNIQLDLLFGRSHSQYRC